MNCDVFRKSQSKWKTFELSIPSFFMRARSANFSKEMESLKLNGIQYDIFKIINLNSNILNWHFKKKSFKVWNCQRYVKHLNCPPGEINQLSNNPILNRLQRTCDGASGPFARRLVQLCASSIYLEDCTYPCRPNDPKS